MNSGERLEIIADELDLLKDIPTLLNKTGDKLVNIKEDVIQSLIFKDNFIFYIIWKKKVQLLFARLYMNQFLG